MEGQRLFDSAVHGSAGILVKKQNLAPRTNRFRELIIRIVLLCLRPENICEAKGDIFNRYQMRPTRFGSLLVCSVVTTICSLRFLLGMSNQGESRMLHTCRYCIVPGTVQYHHRIMNSG
jgi:hypothetical protein